MPQAPSTLDGAFLLHQLFRVDWTSWHQLKEKKRKKIQRQSAEMLERLCSRGDGDDSGALYHVLGHKADLMFVFSRVSGEKLAEVERELTLLPIWPYLEATYSYFSCVELSLHGAHERYRNLLLQQGLAEHSKEWDAALEAMLQEDRQVQKDRLWPQFPDSEYICFYPMDKRRGEVHNWFMLEAPERGKLMSTHGKTGRRYAGKVSQIISSSMGLDDFDWGVSLYSHDALYFKKLIYEMRFDEVSAIYADFGTFFIGRRIAADRLLELKPWSQPVDASE